jgi:hypothetical protein
MVNHDIFTMPVGNYVVGLHLFDTQKRMLNFCKKADYSVTKDTYAIYQPIEYTANIEGILVDCPLIGTFVFCKEHLNHNIITHEAAHAGIDCMRTIKKIELLKLKDGINDMEENLCYYIGDISGSLFNLLGDYLK